MLFNRSRAKLSPGKDESAQCLSAQKTCPFMGIDADFGLEADMDFQLSGGASGYKDTDR